MKVTMLGCGPSWGVPAIGPDWGRCDPSNPRNRRRRCSVLVESRGSILLIDMAPDLRQQFLDAGASRVDAIILTHAHADHLHGLDDVRTINQLIGKAIPLYGAPESLREVQERFAYAVQPVRPGQPMYRPALDLHPVLGPFEAAGLPVVSFPQKHGRHDSLGVRIGGFAYSTDVTELDETAFELLRGTELWIVDCLRREPHPTHSHLAKSLAWINRVAPRRGVLTHMDQNFDYQELAAELPPGVEPGYDGLTFELPDP